LNSSKEAIVVTGALFCCLLWCGDSTGFIK
jgi:hypothetical protein